MDGWIGRRGGWMDGGEVWGGGGERVESCGGDEEGGWDDGALFCVQGYPFQGGQGFAD